MKAFRRAISKTVFTGLVLAGGASLGCGEARADDVPPHVAWGELLLATLDPQKNEYGSAPSYIRWKGDAGAHASENRTVCGSFVTLLLQRAYSMTPADFSGWMGSTSPTAAAYHDAILAGDGFLRVDTVDAIQPGDIIAIKYPAGSGPSGHVAVVTAAPLQRDPSAPVVEATWQYEVAVMDSTSTPHGLTDSRVGSGGAGAGHGVMRFYADALGAVAGHTWSTEGADGFFDQAARHLVIGRVTRERPRAVEPSAR